MKRLIAFVTVLCLVALGSVTAFAAPKEILTVSGPERNTCTPGSTITLTFGLAEGSNAAAVNVEVTYDTDTFEFIEYQNGDLLTDALAAGNNADGKFLFTLATLTPITKAGSLFTVDFKVDSKATGDHSFFFYSTAFSDENNNDIETNTVETVLSVKGDAVSEVSVTPVYSADENNSQYVVSADNGESATGVLVNPDATSSQTAQTTDGEGNGSSTWVIVGVIVLAVGALALLVVAAVVKARKGDKEVENQSILDDDAKALLDLESDALEDKKDKE